MTNGSWRPLRKLRLRNSADGGRAVPDGSVLHWRCAKLRWTDWQFSFALMVGVACAPFALADAFSPVSYQTAPGVVLAGDESAHSHASAGAGTLRSSGRAAQGIQGGNSGSFTTFHAVSNADARFIIDDLIASPLSTGGPAAARAAASID